MSNILMVHASKQPNPCIKHITQKRRSQQHRRERCYIANISSRGWIFIYSLNKHSCWNSSSLFKCKWYFWFSKMHALWQYISLAVGTRNTRSHLLIWFLPCFVCLFPYPFRSHTSIVMISVTALFICLLYSSQPLFFRFFSWLMVLPSEWIKESYFFSFAKRTWWK